MNKHLIMIGSIMVLLVGISSASVQAQDRQNYTDLQIGEGKILPVSAFEGFHAEGILNMSVKHALAILVGVGVGMYIVDNFVPTTLGLPPEFIGILLGALIGNWWYEHDMPPFGH